MKKSNRVLIVEDLAVDADLAKHVICKVLKDCEFQVVETRKHFLKALETFQPDVILSDYSLPHFDGMKALKLTLQHAPLTPLIIWAGSISEDVAVECMKAGANNYILKENLKRLGPAVIHALEERQLLLERKQAEDELRASEARFHTFVDHASDAFYLHEERGIILDVNRQACESLGYTREELIGMTPFDFDVDVKPSFIEQIGAKLDNGELVTFDTRHRRKDGTIFPVEVRIRSFQENGHQFGVSLVRDITDRKQVEEALQNSEKRFRALIENGLDDISLLAPDGTLLWESPSIVRNLGYPPDSFVGHNIFELMHPDDQEWAQKLYQKLVQEAGSREQGTFRLLHFDGTWRWMEAIATNMLNEPSVNAIVINYRDITERKQAEEALRESQAKYQNLVETSHDLIWSVDAEGKITFLNHAAKEIYGYEPEELIGRSFFEIMDPEHYHMDSKEFKGSISDADEFKDLERHVRHRDGRQLILSSNSIVLRDAEGRVTSVTGSSHDITLRKRVEEVLKEERNLLRTLIDNIPDRIYAMDTQGRKTLSNTADWMASGGKAMEDVIGKTDFDTYPPELAEEFWQLDKAVLDSGQPIINHEEPGLDADGNRVSILTTKVPLRDSEGKVIGLVGIGRDITERKQAEEKLQLSDQILQRVSALVLVADPQGNIVYVSPAAKTILGYEPEELLGDNWWKLSPSVPIEAQAEKEYVGRAAHGVVPIPTEAYERSIRDRWGNIHWISWVDTAGPGDLLIGVGHDITERKQAEIERQTLLEIMQGIASTKDLQELLKLVHHSIARVIYAENFFVALYQPNSGLFEEIYFVDRYDDTPTPPAKLEKSITSYIFRSGQPLLLTQTRFNELIRQGEVELVGANFESWLGAPLKTSGKTIGVIAVQDYERPNRYSERDRDFLESIATQVALAIERKQAEDAVHKSEALYRQAIEVAGAVPYYESYYDEGRSIKYEFIGEGIRQITGYGPEEFSATLWDSLVEEVNLVENLAGYSLDEGIQQVRFTGENSIWKCEHRLRDRDGKIHWVFEAAVELRDENGVSHGSIGTYQDITTRRQAENAEREQRALAEALRDTAETLSSTLDYGEVLDHILAAVGRVVPHDAATIMLIDGESAHVVRSYGYDKRGFDFEVMGIRLPLAETNNLRQMLETGQTVVIPDTHSYPGWKRLSATDWLHSNVGAPISIYGEVIGFILLDSQTPGFFTPVHAERLEAFANQAALAIHNAQLLQQAQAEIAERKQAEEELRASEERFRQLADNIQEAFWMTNVETDEEMYISPAAEIIWERSVESLVHEPNAFINSVFPEDQPAILGAMEKEKNGEKVEIEYRIIRPNGSVRWVWDRAFPIFDDSGKVKRIAGISADITERRESEIALVKSQNRYRELFDSSPISIWEEDFSLVKKRIDFLLESGVTDLRAYLSSHPDEVGELASLIRITDVNKASLELYHVEQKEQLLKGLTEALGKEDAGHFQEEILGLMGPLKRFAWEGTDKIGNGRQMEVIVNGSIPHGYEEDWSKVIVSISDITERKQAEQALLKREKQLEEAQRLGHIGSWEWDMQTGAMMWSDEMYQLYDRDSQLPPFDLASYLMHIYPDDQERILQSLQQTAQTHQPFNFDYRALTENGKIRWMHVRGEMIMDDTGQPLRLQGIAQDITERRQTEQQLRKLSRAVEQSASTIVITDTAGNIEYVNPKFTEITGYSPEEVIGENPRILKSGFTSNEDYKQLWQMIASGKEWHGELLNKKKNGELFWEYATISPILNENRETTHFLAVKEDITERKRAEEEIRRRAEETSALLQTSLALTNLDLKATLQTIGNYAKALFAGDGCRIFLMQPDGESLQCVMALQENSDAFSDLRIKVGEGVTGAVAASGQAEIVNEMQNDPRGVQVLGTIDNEPEAIMFAPLKERDRTIGVLSVRRMGTERPFQPAELALLEAFASMAASAVSNARLFEETQHRLAELEALYENGLAVGRLLKPREIGNRIIQTFARYLPWHHVTIRLKREESENLDLVAFNLPNLKEEERTETEQHFVALVNKVGQGLSGWVIQTGIPLRTGNVHAHPQYVDTHPEIQSGLYMPLKVGERVIGVISVESEAPDAFTEQDERLLATLANQAAIAFENARLYQAIEQELLERQRAEEALRASETHYRELADSITDILFEMDQNLHYTHWNKASETLTGIQAKDAIGKSMQEIFGESEEQTRISQIYESVLKNRQPRTFETTLFLNGQKPSFEINAYPSTRGVSVVAKDVTDRKRSETIMQKRFELMEYSAHHSLNELMQRTTDEVSELTGSAIAFFHFMEENQTTLGMQTWSTNALRLFHVPINEGTHLPLDQAGVWADAARQRRPLIQNDYESLAKRKGLPQGHVPITREMIIPIIRAERIVAIMGIANKPQDYTQYDLQIAERLADYAWDITERKQMELALEAERNRLAQRVDERTADLSRANSNLARALRVKDEFLANMSHELRTPLNAILGLSESLSEQIAGPLNEKQQKYISTISESGHHLLSLINDILDLAKIDAGQITLDINKVDVHSVCQASLRMIKQLAQKKNQEVSLEIDDGLGLMWADERRLKQMLVNLLGNAVKFTPENGRLGLEVHGDEEANKISFTVWDKGIGIRDEDLLRLFQPFVQLDSGLARETTGTGLGLVLVAQMARLHGGGINAVSEPENGSRFTIVLPWEPALAMDAATRMKITGKFRAIKLDEKNQPIILLVEDTKEVTMMVKDYLELAGYKVVTAQDGVDAIVQAKLVRPDLILMDVQMPRMDGLEATRKLRSEPDFRYTPIIALTALAMPSDRERCLEAGMDEYISKPINLKALIKIIQGCLLNDQEARTR